MKILLSAYACEPNRGSEPEVGWNWALTLANKGHDTFVITRKNNKKSINKYLLKNKKSNLKFVYYDLPKFLLNIFKKKKISYLYFYLWQIGVFFFTLNLVKKKKFDYIHHVTFVSLRIPVFLNFHKIPLIIGPVAGGDKIPYRLRKSFSLKENLYELIRDFNNIFIKFSFFIQFSLFKSKKIFVNSSETFDLIPAAYKKKTKILLAIAVNKIRENYVNKINKQKIFQICYVGRLLHWKGLNISLNVIKKLNKKKNIIFKIAGTGPYKKKIIKFINDNNLSKIIILEGNLNKYRLKKLYQNSHLLLFPSLRDSGGYVVLEAARFNVISAVLDIGGPGQLIDKFTGIKIPVKNKTEKQIINMMTRAIISHIENKSLFKKKIINFKKKINRQFTWDQKYKDVYEKNN